MVLRGGAADVSAAGSVLDSRYAPPDWQTAICLPDDTEKTLVGRDGALLYDYPGAFGGFGTRISLQLGKAEWRSQELDSARVPLVRTRWQMDGVEMIQEAFAVTTEIRTAPDAVAQRLGLERVGQRAANLDWAHPPAGTDPAFRHIAVGYNEPVTYRWKARANERFRVVFGLCEGWHTNAAQRVLTLQVEGRGRRTVDLIGESGRNVPALFAFSVGDEDGDGWVTVGVAPAPGSPDTNAILNVLWILPERLEPDLAALRAGREPAGTLAHVSCGAEDPVSGPLRRDFLLACFRNPTPTALHVEPVLRVETAGAFAIDSPGRARIGRSTRLTASVAWDRVEDGAGMQRLVFPAQVVAARSETWLAVAIDRGLARPADPRLTVATARAAREKARRYWERLDLPYGRIQVPDRNVRSLLEGSIRNIFQAREIKRGLPAFQVGPTCYRGLWVVDGSFLLEAMTFLGRTNDTRHGVEYLMSFQRPDGGFMLIDGHWKETGIALWAVARHAELTGDRAWLASAWPRVQRGVAQIRAMRSMPAADAPNAGLVPDGFSDGGLADRVPEYTNVYWTMAGLRAAVQAARWLGRLADAAAWQREYDDFEATFRRAARRDLRRDARGNDYLPIRMAKGEGIPPQKAQWAFCHAVFPGRVFSPEDPLVRGNLAMLEAVECEGLVRDTGWLKQGIWNYFGSFYGHAWLWLGDGAKAARTLYAFGNHASPTLCWREEQMPVGEGKAVVGDMPHNWASAEFIRLVRHALVLERGDELHLLQGLPANWVRPGAETRVDRVLTTFGPVSFRLRVEDGIRFELDPPTRTSPRRIVLHTETWHRPDSAAAAGSTSIELPTDRKTRMRLKLHPEPY